MKWTWNSRFLVIHWCYIHRHLPKTEDGEEAAEVFFSSLVEICKTRQFLIMLFFSITPYHSFSSDFASQLYFSQFTFGFPLGEIIKTHAWRPALWCQSLPAESSSNWLPSLQDKSKTVDNWTSRRWAGGHGGQRFASRGCSLIHFVCSSLSATLSPLSAHLQPSFSRCHIKSCVHFWSEVLNLSTPICSAKLHRNYQWNTRALTSIFLWERPIKNPQQLASCWTHRPAAVVRLLFCFGNKIRRHNLITSRSTGIVQR